jgi:hypothetical protein
LVFGDPEQNGDTIESERYEAGEAYPSFTVEPGDLLLLYCTEGYATYARQFPGIGVTVRTKDSLIEYRRIAFSKPIGRASIDDTFDVDDRKKMTELRFNIRRAFQISGDSFARTVARQTIEV